jgi:hypothetical protein
VPVDRPRASITYLSSLPLPLPLLLLLAVVATGCEPAPGAGGCAEIPCGAERVATWRTQTTILGDIDALFVLDDTPAFAPYLEPLRMALPSFADVFESFPRGAPSLHVRFVSAGSSDAGCAGPGARAALCGLDGDFLQTGLCGASPNVSGSLADAFSCLGDLGVASCAPPQPLEAMRRALAGGDGFLRAHAYLVVVIVAGTDDASGAGAEPTAVEGYIDALRALKPDPDHQIFVAVIGPAAPRLSTLASAFGRRGSFVPLSSPSWAAALGPLAEESIISTEPTCIAGVQDLDPARPGLQADCVVEDGIAPRPIPRCDDGPPPCWRMDASSLCRGGWYVTIDRGADWCSYTPTLTTYTCLVCLDPREPACAGPSPGP